VSATGTVGVREKAPIRVCTARQRPCQPPLNTYNGTVPRVMDCELNGLASFGKRMRMVRGKVGKMCLGESVGDGIRQHRGGWTEVQVGSNV
jgi:hypothetical protein